MYGPVVPSVYDYYKKFGSNGIVLEDDPQLIQLTPQEDDPLFERFKQPDVIGPDYRGPQEWLEGARSVVSVFPFFLRSY